MNRFTAYRRNLAERGTHNEYQMNAASEPQFEGVVWSDGTVTLRWLTACKSHSVWSSLEDMLRIHGHPEYGTEIVWHDGPPPKLYIEMFGLPKPQPSKVDGVSDSLRERVARAICSSCDDDPDAQGDAGADMTIDEIIAALDSYARVCSGLAEQHKSDPVLSAALTDAVAIIRDSMRELRGENVPFEEHEHDRRD